MEEMGKRERTDHQDLREIKEQLELQVLGGLLGRRVCLETQVYVELKENLDCRVHQEEELSTLAGAGQPAPLTKELNCSILGKLGGHTIVKEVEQPITCAFQMILTTFSMRVECKAIGMWLE